MTTQKWFNGKLHWLDLASGDGMVKAETGELIYCHVSALTGPVGFSVIQ